MDFKKEEDYNILRQNEMAIANLTKIVEKTSRDVDKLVEKQTEILINQQEMNLLTEKINDNDKRIEKLENSFSWTIKSIIGGIFSILVGIILFKLKGM